VRALAERASDVLVTSMFQGLAVGWADLVLPGTSYLERDGTYVNLEGRLQRLRRSVIPPAPDELAWISKLAERFERRAVALRLGVFAELSERHLRRLPFGEVGEQAPSCAPRSEAPRPSLPERRRPKARACS
jgi:anaerobic selenocysteine-containing dehydrogenase